MKRLKSEITTIATQHWRSKYKDEAWHYSPIFFENKNGKMKRVPLSRGIELIKLKVLGTSQQLQEYFQVNNISI